MTRLRGAVTLVVTALTFGLAPGCGSSSKPSADQPTAGSQPAASPTSAHVAPGAVIPTRPATLPTNDPVTASPTRLVISAARLDIAVKPVGVAPDGQMELPPDPSVIGWYRFGPAPGEGQGAVVLGGHLDSKQYGAGPLVRLRRLSTGDLITIRSSSGSTAQYRVKKVEDIAKKKLPIDRLFDRDGPATLRIITCGGPYDRNGGGYRDNLVVTAWPA